MENLSVMDFNVFDITIAALVLLLAIKGFIHGFVKEIIGLVGLLGGVYFASRLSKTAADFIDQNFIHLENTTLLQLIGFIAILLIIWLSATILGSIFSKLTNQSGLGFLNRLLGLIAGGGKYFFIFGLIVTALSNISFVKDNFKEHIESSILYPYLHQAGSYLINQDSSILGLQSTSSTEVKKEVIIHDNSTVPSSTSEINKSAPSE